MNIHAILRWVYYRFSPRGRLILRRLYYLPYDLFHRRKRMVPPRGMIFVGEGDFILHGQKQREAVIRCTGLQPDGAILDVGSGIGRLAVAMTSYLNENGRFEGFDVVQQGVDWCREHISNRYSNFVFRHVDLRNSLYNLSTESVAEEYIFPYPNNQFDVVSLFSVFSHMIPADVEHYFAEIRRVLRPGGYCIATFFILNEVSLLNIRRGRTGEFTFPYRHDGYAYLDEKVKETNVAYEKDYLLSMIDRNGLVCETLELGRWGDPTLITDQFQDLVILRNP